MFSDSVAAKEWLEPGMMYVRDLRPPSTCAIGGGQYAVLVRNGMIEVAPGRLLPRCSEPSPSRCSASAEVVW